MRLRDPAILIAALAALAVVNASGADAIREFLDRHWRRPLAPQGPAPARFSPLEASLQPEACGTCHPAQLADWKTSLHSRSMGSGVAGQLVEMLESDPGSALSCFTCRAPLAEQAPRVMARDSPSANPVYDAALGARGLVCAGCHVRDHQRFGPPHRDGSLASATPRETLPHNGVTRTPAFLSSAFCEGCHQFTSDGFALNGKLLENTYNEWRASRFARDGVQC